MVNAGSQRVALEEGREVISVEDQDRQFIARVLVWANGGSMAEIAAAPSDVLVMDEAQQCLEDITEATS